MVESLTFKAPGALISLAMGAALLAGPATAQDILKADAFIPGDMLESPLHRFHPDVSTNGFSNVYTIESPIGLQRIEGTEQAIMRVREIHATEVLRDRSTVGSIANSAKNRTLNLVETPIRILGSVGDEWNEVETAGDAILFVPVQTGNLVGKFAAGIGEMGVTGVRIVRGAAGTKCNGFGCVEKAGKDIWSGLNSLTGKHDVTRKLHAEMGTSSETTYQPLKNQVDRISYADAYTGTAYKFGLGVNGYRINYFSDVVTGTGYANNAEFLASYQDADRIKNENKDRLIEWGVSQQTLDTLYNNPNYSKLRRIRLVTALRQLGNPVEQARFARGAAHADSRYNADAHIAAYEYLAALAQTGRYQGLVEGAPVAIARIADGRWVMPVISDHLLPSEKSLAPAKMLARASGSQTARPEIHVLGTVSPDYRREMQRLGITVLTVPTRP